MPSEGSARQIAKLEKGNKSRTARHADVMNELIDALNRWAAIKIVPAGSGKFIFSDSNIILDLKNVAGTIDLAAEDVGDLPEGEDAVDNIRKITFDNTLFKIHDNGNGEAQVSLITDDCADSGLTLD